MLTPLQAREILRMDCTPKVDLFKRTNDVYRVGCEADTFFLKTYTKDWYGDNIAGTAFCVDHEISAWRVMSKYGLAVPEVITSDLSCENALERPFVVTRGLRGKPLTTWLAEVDSQHFALILRAVGNYMRQMHAIVFDYPGYISSAGLSAPPDPDQWQHTIWTAEQFKKDARRIWSEDANSLPADLMAQVDDFYARHMPALANSYLPPRFTHGDCHASQFFLYQEDDQWRVSGVVDMEVSSGGDCGADLVKFGLEMAGTFPAATRWWVSFFEGYAGAPSLDLMKLRFLAAHHINFVCYGDQSWPGTREEIVRHILKAENWETLFDMTQIRLAR